MMKKKMVKFLSVVMLFSMMMSMMTAGAFALVEDGKGNAGIVIGGSSSVSVNDGSGVLTIGADQRPADDSPYAGTVVENNGSDYDSAIADAKEANAAVSATDVQIAEVAKTYLAKEDGDYSGIVDSEYDLVLANQDFLMYVRDNIGTIDAETLQTAIDLFGEDAVYGSIAVSFDAEAAKADMYAVIAQMFALENDYADLYPEDPAYDQILNVEWAGKAEYAELASKLDAITKILEDYNVNGNGASFMNLAPGFDPSKVSQKWQEVCPGKGNSMAEALQHNTTLKFMKAFDICNSSDYRITINLRGVTIDSTGCDVAFYIKGKTISFTNGTIIGDGFYVDANGVLNLGGLVNTTADIMIYAVDTAVYVAPNGVCVVGQGTTINGWREVKVDGVVTKVPATGNAIQINSGVVKMTGGFVNGGNATTIANWNGELELSSSVVEVNNTYGYPAIEANSDTKATVAMHGGSVLGSTGIAVQGKTTTLTVNGGSITGTMNPSSQTAFPNNGAAVTVFGDATDTGAASPYVFINGGTLRSEYNAGLVNIVGAARPASVDNITRIAVDDVNVTIQEAPGQTSDYARIKYLLKHGELTSGYRTLKDAVTAAADGDKITMISDETITAAVAINKAITLEGNGHTISVSGDINALELSGSNVVLQNLNLKGEHKTGKAAILVSAGKAYIGSDISADHFDIALSVSGGNVTVNGFDVDDDTTTGIKCTGTTGSTTVIMCKIDAENPIDVAAGASLKIEGGWFLYKAGPKIGPTSTATITPTKAVATFVDPDVSYVKYVEKDKYYEVLFNDTPTVEIVSGASGYDTDGTPYVTYNKADPDPIVLNITPAVKTITAVSSTNPAETYNLFTAEAGKSGNIRIPDVYVLQHCPAGRYDLQFTFMNGYIIKEKLSFYVFPKIAKLFDVPNTSDYTLTMTQALIDRLTSYYEITSTNYSEHDVGSDHNIAVVMSERPDKICIGNVPDGSSEMLLENYSENNYKILNTNTWAEITSGTYAGCYLYYISSADLNNLAVGQNYVFLEWDGVNGALKRLPLTIANSNVSISPSKLDWSNVSSYANFTVKPSVDTVYIDGEKVDSSYWTYDTNTHVLSVKGSYLNVLKDKEHVLEVITPQGKVSATLNTGVGIIAKGVDYHVYGGARALSFVTSDVINQEAGIWIGSSNPTRLDPSAYTWDSKTGFTLNAAFLNRLSLGTYYISCYVYNGTEYEYTTTTFRVISASQASYTPATGDNSNIFVWVTILLLSAVAIVVIILPRMKKSTKTGK